MSKEQDRLLTEEEIGAAIDLDSEAEYRSGGAVLTTLDVKPLLKAQDTKTREATCKEIGEILEKDVEGIKAKMTAAGTGLIGFPTLEGRIKALKQGKLPQQGEKG